MKHLNKSIIFFFFFLSLTIQTNAQMGIIEAVDGIIVGNSGGNTNGLVRYTGSDFEGRDGGIWKSLTSGFSPWELNGSNSYYDQGWVGIGNEDPLVELHITGSHEMLRLEGTSPWMALRETGQTNYGYNWMIGGNLKIGVSDDKNIDFNTDGTERMRIDGTGQVGIGTDSPMTKLHVKSDLEAIRLDGSSPWLSFYDGANYLGYLFHNSTNMSLFNRENGSLNFGTNNGVRLSINPNGNTAIGALVANAKLDVRGSAIFNDNGIDADFRIESNDDENMIFVDGGNNRVGIGTSTPNAELEVNGRIQMLNTWIQSDGTNGLRTSGGIKPITNNTDDLGNGAFKWRDVWAQNGTIQTSDERLKKDVKNLDYGLKEIMQLSPVRFKWNSGFDDSYKLGLIAQELQQVVGEVVKTHYYEISENKSSAKKVELENLGVYYSDLIPVLINAIKEQQSQIETLKKEMKIVQAK
jgi:hypothetical protein